MVERIGGSLHVSVKPDAVQWSYGLNTANFPTYGGEVVQILSAYFDDMTIQGTVTSYKDIEILYGYFIDYMQIATQGKRDGTQGDQFDHRPMTMVYKERDWRFRIYPKSLPGFKYGRDVVAPTWQLVAAIQEPDADFSQRLIELSRQKFLEGEGVELFGKATITDFADPFSDPFSGVTKETYEKDKLRSAYGELADYYNNLIPSYLSGDFEDLSADYSRPSFLAGQPDAGNENTGTPEAQEQVDNGTR